MSLQVTVSAQDQRDMTALLVFVLAASLQLLSAFSLMSDMKSELSFHVRFLSLLMCQHNVWYFIDFTLTVIVFVFY